MLIALGAIGQALWIYKMMMIRLFKNKYMFYMLIYGCIVTIAIFIFRLAYQNWNEKIHGSIISICLIGCATVLVAVLASLKETLRDEKFVAVIGVEENFKPYPVSYQASSQDKLALRSLTDISKYGDPISFTNYDYYNQRLGRDVFFSAMSMPQKPEQWLILNSEALTYEIYRAIFSNSLFRDIVAPSRSNNPYSFWTDALGIKMPSDTVHAQLSKEDFEFRVFKRHLVNGESFRCPLPRGTKIKIESYKNKPSGRYDYDTSQHVNLILTKPNFFKIEFRVHALPYSKLPIHLKDLRKKKLFGYSVVVEYKARFEKLTSGSPLSNEYVDWADSIFEVLKKRYAWNN